MSSKLPFQLSATHVLQVLCASFSALVVAGALAPSAPAAHIMHTKPCERKQGHIHADDRFWVVATALVLHGWQLCGIWGSSLALCAGLRGGCASSIASGFLTA